MCYIFGGRLEIVKMKLLSLTYTHLRRITIDEVTFFSGHSSIFALCGSGLAACREPVAPPDGREAIQVDSL